MMEERDKERGEERDKERGEEKEEEWREIEGGERIRLRIEKARAKLKAAQELLLSGNWDDSASRSCLAVFHSALALVESIGASVRTFEGLRTVIKRLFTEPGKIPGELLIILDNLKIAMDKGDYTLEAISEDEAKAAFEDAQKFIESVEKFLRGRGFIPP